MHQIQHLMTRLVVVAIVAMVGLGGTRAWVAQNAAGNEQDQRLVRGERPKPRDLSRPRRSPRHLHEREFAEAPEMAALPHNVVILDLEPASSAQEELRENVVRYRLNDGTYNFCLGKDDPHLSALTLADDAGQALVKVDRSTGCLQAKLSSGTYRMSIWHDASAIEGAGLVAFVQAPEPIVPLRTDTGLRGGYYALRPDPASDPTGKQRQGRLRALPPPQNIDVINPKVMPVIADWTSQQIDDTALFYLADDTGTTDPNNPHRPRILSGNSPLNITLELYTGTPYLFADANGVSLLNPFTLGSQLYTLDLTELGGESYTVKLAATIPLLSTQGFVLDNNSVLNWSSPYPDWEDAATTFRVLFRFFPDGTQIDQLLEGEVALFQECNYQGKAIVVIADTPDFSALTSSTITLDKSTASIKLGNNTAVTLYSGDGFSGTQQLIEIDTPCLDGTPIGRNTTSIQVSPLAPIFLASKTCEGCELEGIDLSGKDLSGTDLMGADLSGAKLNGITCQNCRWNHITLDGATGLAGLNLSGIVLSGAKLRGKVDLSHAVLSTQLDGADLTGAILDNAILQNANLENAILDQVTGLAGVDLSSVASLKGAHLHGVDLTRAVLPQISDGIDLTGATLTGVKLQNVSLQNAILDQVIGLAGADLSQVGLNGVSLQKVNFSSTKFYGARLNQANLDGSNLSGAFLTNNQQAGINEAANLSGAHLKNVNLSNAQLSGTTFTNASFYGSVPAGQGTCGIDPQGFTQNCASAAGATLNNTLFGGAYLYGVDFTNTTIQGVQFGNAVLIGANFSGAKLSTDPSVGTESGFTNAFLQGANLATATLIGTSLQGAFVDFRDGGNDMYLQLDGTHTVFPGWQTPGQQACVFAFYSQPTTVPTNNTTLTCPDGSAAGSGCGPTEASNLRWKSPIDIAEANPHASYLQDATYTQKAGTPICSPLNPNW
jgi:uncharacterized protein YjbI with pentapeptide repeats